MAMKIINKQSIIGIEKSFICAKLRTIAWRHRFEKHLNCVLPDYKMGEAYKGKTHKVDKLFVNN